jgi:ATP-binding cassette subfamily F protein 3
MISISDLDFHFGSRALYDGASLHIKPKDKIGLIGLNGTGKSTLLRLLVGEYKADGGSISMSKEASCTWLCKPSKKPCTYRTRLIKSWSSSKPTTPTT